MLRKWPNVPVDENGLSPRTDLALDSEYQRRWVEFHMSDGTIKDSRFINWRHVMWDQVDKLAVHIREKKRGIDRNDCIGFKCFLNFRKISHLNVPDKDGRYQEDGETSIVWVIGWTDGVRAYLTDISFHTGEIVREYTKTLDDVLGHIHPRCREGLEQA